MNGIVTGKVEVPSGSLVWKPRLSYTFTEAENYQVDADIQTTPFINEYIKLFFTDYYNNGKVNAYIPLTSVPDSSDTIGLGIAAVHQTQYWNYSQEVKVYLFLNIGSHYIRFRGKNNYAYPSDYFTGFEIGTLS